MSLALPRRRPALTAALALGLTLGLSGCGAGLRAQTYQERNQAESTNEAIGTIAVRNLYVEAPEGEGSAVYEIGDDAVARVSFTNDGPEADELVSVTAEGASSVDVVGLDGRERDVVVPPLSTVDDVALVLRGLTKQVRTGTYLEMELTFRNGGTEAMLVPVQLTGIPGPRREGYHVTPTDSNGDPLVEEGGDHGGGEDHGSSEDHEEPAAGEQGQEGGPQGGIGADGTAGSGQAEQSQQDGTSGSVSGSSSTGSGSQ